MFFGDLRKRRVSELSEAEAFALAIANEEEDQRIYLDCAAALRKSAPKSAACFEDMARVEANHRRRLIARYEARFADAPLPLVKREHIAGMRAPPPVWLLRARGIAFMRGQAEMMETQARRFYEYAARESRDAATRKLFGDLAMEEAGHERQVADIAEARLGDGAGEDEDSRRRRAFILQYVQPGLAGLMDGSVSTLAPLFAAAFATQSSHDAFLVGLAASIGAGISMGFTEALSDDGIVSGRGSPAIRGVVTGFATTIGGVGHTLPYLLHDFTLATVLAVLVVVIELVAIAWIRWKYMDTRFLSAVFQIVVGGLLVFGAGVAIGRI